MEKWKQATKEVYEKYAKEYMQRTEDYWERFPDAKKIMKAILLSKKRLRYKLLFVV